MRFLKVERSYNKNFITKITTKAWVIMCLVLFLPASSTFALTAGELDQKIKDVNSKLSQVRAEKRTLAEQVEAFDNQIYSVQLQINSTQGEINALTEKISETNKQIEEATIKLKTQQEIMKEYLRTIYIEGQVSTVELIAKSENFSDFVDRSEYLGSIQQSVQETADTIVELQKELDTKKKELEVEKSKSEQLKTAQLLQQQSISNQRAVKDSLLAQTKGSEANYQSLLNNLYQQRAALSAKNNETVRGGGSAYPYANADPNGVDPWGMYYRQCTSYAAWRSATYGPVPGSVISNWGHNYRANGGDWGYLASLFGYTVNSTPSPGAIMSFPYGLDLPYGHVAIVKSVNANGTVNVSEYNWSIPLGYSERDNVRAANYGAVFIH